MSTFIKVENNSSDNQRVKKNEYEICRIKTNFFECLIYLLLFFKSLSSTDLTLAFNLPMALFV